MIKLTTKPNSPTTLTVNALRCDKPYIINDINSIYHNAIAVRLAYTQDRAEHLLIVTSKGFMSLHLLPDWQHATFTPIEEATITVNHA